MDKIKYFRHLESYLSPRRKALIDLIPAQRTRHFTIVAEDTYLDHNASILIRNCECFGIQDLHIIEEHNTYRLAKGMTQGSDKWVDLHYYSEREINTQTCINTLRKKRYAIIATSPHGNEYPLDDYDINTKSAFFFGKERTGLSHEVLDQADSFIKIPMFGFSESFNISVSVALLLQPLMKKLRDTQEIEFFLSHSEIVGLKIDWSIKAIQNGDRIAKKYLTEHS